MHPQPKVKVEHKLRCRLVRLAIAPPPFPGSTVVSKEQLIFRAPEVCPDRRNSLFHYLSFERVLATHQQFLEGPRHVLESRMLDDRILKHIRSIVRLTALGCSFSSTERSVK